MASDAATAATMATMIRYTSGVLCVAMEGDRMDELALPAMVVNNEDPKVSERKELHPPNF